MSHTICVNCGKPHAPQVTTQQAREEWPTRVQDILYMMKKLGLSVTVNENRMGVPDPPEWVPSDKSITANARRVGVPDPPPWVEPKAALTTNENRQGVPGLRFR